MTHEPRVYDSWAIVAYLRGEPAGQKVKALLLEEETGQDASLITTVNLGEVWYSLCRDRGEAEADALVGELSKLGIEVVEADWELAHEAARLKAKHGVAFADCFAAALAKLRDLEVVTGDPEFHEFGDEVKVYWL